MYAHEGNTKSVGSRGLGNLDLGERHTQRHTERHTERNLDLGTEKLARSSERRDGSRDGSRRPNIEPGDIKGGKVSCLSKPH